MKKGQLLLILIFVHLIFLLPVSLFAQMQMNGDSLLLVAHEKAISGDYDEAISICNQILDQYPNYTDVQILKARTLAWDKEYDEAINEINQVLLKDEGHFEANTSLCDFHLWNGNLDLAIEAVNKALGFSPDNEALLLKKAQIEMELGEYSKTTKTTRRILEIDPNNEQAQKIDESIRLKSWKNEFRVEHYFDHFKQPYLRRWHMSSFGYGRKTPFGVFYGKIYFGDLVGSGESLYGSEVSKQYSVECYPKIDKNNYMFLNYSFSSDAFFPNNRVGIEYYHVFKNKFEISLGYRYLQFTAENQPDVNVNIYTGSIARYMGNFWVSARPYIIDDGQDISYKYTLAARNYFKREISYLELSVGTGTSPENPAFYTGGAQRAQLDSWRIEMEWKQRLSKLLSFEIETGYENAEYQKDRRRDQLIVRAALSFLF